MGVRAHEADEGPVDRAGVGDREQVVEQLPAQRAVVAARSRRWPVRRRRPTTGTTGRCASRSASTVSSSRRAPSRSPARAWNPAATAWAWAGAPIHQRTASAASVAQFGRVVAGPDDLEALRHAHVAGVAVADRLAEGGGLGAEPLAGLDVAVEQGERGLPGAQQVVVAGLAQPFGEVPRTRRGWRGRPAIRSPAARWPSAAAPGRAVPGRRPAGPGRRSRRRSRPVRWRCPASTACRGGRAGSWPGWPGRRGCGRSRPPARPAAGPVAGRPARSAAAGGPARRSPAPRPAYRMPARAWWAVSSTAIRSVRGMAKRAPTRSRPSATAPSRSGRPVADGPGPGVSSSARARAASPARSRRSASAVSSPTRSASGSRLAGVGDGGPDPGQVAGGLGEREPGGVGLGGRPRPGHRGRGAGTGTAAAKWRASSAGEHRAAPLVAAQQRGGDPVVQVEPPGRGQRGVDRLPVEVVGEPWPASAGRGAGEDPGRGRLGDQVGDLGSGRPGDVGEHVGQQLVPATAAASSRAAHACGQPGQPAAR